MLPRRGIHVQSEAHDLACAAWHTDADLPARLVSGERAAPQLALVARLCLKRGAHRHRRIVATRHRIQLGREAELGALRQRQAVAHAAGTDLHQRAQRTFLTHGKHRRCVAHAQIAKRRIVRTRDDRAREACRHFALVRGAERRGLAEMETQPVLACALRVGRQAEVLSRGRSTQVKASYVAAVQRRDHVLGGDAGRGGRIEQDLTGQRSAPVERHLGPVADPGPG